MSNKALALNPAAPAFDVNAARMDFPILSRLVHNKPLVYLDNGASAQKPKVVLDAILSGYSDTYANVHRGAHFLSNESTNLFEKARESCRCFVNAERVEEIVFTKGGTEAINLVASSLGAEIGEGDEIVISEMEHHSNIVPWNFLRERKGAKLIWAPLAADDSFDLEAFAKLLTKKTRIVAITHMSNVLGTVTPIADIIRLAHAAGAKVLIDGCQGSVHEIVDVQALDVDFYVTTGHKLYGPSGIGFLYGKYELLEAMQPYQGGGEMIADVFRDVVTYAAPPHRFEAGTPPIVEAIGLGVALDYLQNLDRAGIAAHEAALLAHATEEIDRIGKVRIFGRAPNKGAIVTFDVEGAHPQDVSMILDRAGVAVRAGSHCAQPLMTKLGLTASARASFALYNTHEEVEALVKGIRRVLELFA
ncbi:SufS family cysteine desulfurase [Rhodoblastus acidophilus]|uniref:Cysteine desulfurase n=1 Tax=Candidatus Rhodoblastus alkanivorans TaxID=2954117 RepID=A0ABS9ZA36_9HYPH|nr:SufS family cysteine desulfurase [Candidatus Rhodoblastus alkanivorans]MCI4677130.1 SufS family cysteine desulfurase [Candidatus Rhodoblastus alkanivorans]MCI4684483.1 SufS family cysteine desulfurase [Candidatus Rhodoblastus alkanivorans]MDI4641804.1 SufS family cysteine desulfurase [Rhodoblastus acidophilus]